MSFFIFVFFHIFYAYTQKTIEIYHIEWPYLLAQFSNYSDSKVGANAKMMKTCSAHNFHIKRNRGEILTFHGLLYPVCYMHVFKNYINPILTIKINIC